MNFGKYRKKVTISLAIFLHDRMTQYYESVTHSRTLTRRMPVIIRCDMECGKAFTNKLKKPWDDVFSEAMQRTVCDMAEKIQGCVLGYTASDEISLLLLDYQELNTDAWFSYNIDKLVSSAASMATIFFFKNFVKEVLAYKKTLPDRMDGCDECYYNTLLDKIQGNPIFDARAFNIPKEEVANYFLDRQRYTEKNSISMLARYYFSHKEIEGKNGSQMKDMLVKECNVNWDNCPVVYKYGVFCKKDGLFCIDKNSPIVSRNRDYIESLVFVGE